MAEELALEDILTGVRLDQINRNSWAEILVCKLADHVSDANHHQSVFTVDNIADVFKCILRTIVEENQCTAIDLMLSALSNATILPNYVEIFHELVHTESLCMSQFQFMINKYNSHNPQAEQDIPVTMDDVEHWTQTDPWQHVASVLCNLCQCSRGRDMVAKDMLKTLIPQVASPLVQVHGMLVLMLILQLRSRNTVRQRGTAGCLKRCGSCVSRLDRSDVQTLSCRCSVRFSAASSTRTSTEP